MPLFNFWGFLGKKGAAEMPEAEERPRKERMYCPSCMHEVDEGPQYCPLCGKDLTEKNDVYQLPVGTVLGGRYQIGRRIGEGGFGITYIGVDRKIGKRIAVKEYFPHGFVSRISGYSNNLTVTSGDYKAIYEHQKGRFVEEARILAEFAGDPNVVQISDILDAFNTAYLVMEYIDGVTLDGYHQKHGNLYFPEILRMLRPVIRTLSEMHEKGLIHRDVSPANIMVTTKNYVKLLDFGAVSDFETDPERSKSVILKPGYAPPEQYNRHGDQGPWSDVYALCATMYFLLTGSAPDNAIERVGLDTLRRPSDRGAVISPEEEAVLLCGMATKIEDRFSSMRELDNALQEAERGKVVEKALPYYVPAAGTGGASEKPDDADEMATLYEEIPAPVASDVSEEAATPDEMATLYEEIPAPDVLGVSKEADTPDGTATLYEETSAVKEEKSLPESFEEEKDPVVRILWDMDLEIADREQSPEMDLLWA